MHHGHHPEIDIIDATTATGIWYLEDYLIFVDTNSRLHGAGLYDDRYVKHADGWRIQHTGYSRTFEQFQDGSASPPVWRLTR
jgi:hypothetical protein